MYILNFSGKHMHHSHHPVCQSQPALEGLTTFLQNNLMTLFSILNKEEVMSQAGHGQHEDLAKQTGVCFANIVYCKIQAAVQFACPLVQESRFPIRAS